MDAADGEDALTTPCFICGGELGAAHTAAYRRCAGCGHETLREGQSQQFILNDPPTLEDTNRLTRLDRFKRSTLRQAVGGSKAVLADIGSATGRFLHQNRDLVDQSFGLEVTPEALDFSRHVLGLNVVEDVRELPGNLTLITAWHSLEHVPAAVLPDMLAHLAARLAPGGHFIVSVPNAQSNQYRWYGESYAYYDAPNHLHQFTHASLEALMLGAGFRRRGEIDSWVYNLFGHAQGLLNRLTGSHNYLYYRFKRKQGQRQPGLDLANALLLPAALGLGCLLTAMDSLSHEKQGVITACFQPIN
jgi:SAM-dependent methyltransferase